MRGKSRGARAFVGMGSSLGDRLRTLRDAVSQMARGAILATRARRVSSPYETRPIGGARELFLNAVVELRTELPPLALLGALLELEALHGRVRGGDVVDRTLDLDLLLYAWRTDDRDATPAPLQWESYDIPGLTLPHPRLAARDFVLVPLAELEPDLPILGPQTPRQLLAAIPDADRTVIRRCSEPLAPPTLTVRPPRVG